MRAVRPRAAKRMQSASATSCPCIVCCSSPRRQQAPPRRQVEDRSSHAQLSLTGFGYHFWTCCGAAGEHTFEHTLTSPRQQAIAWRASEQQEALISLSITSGSPQVHTQAESSPQQGASSSHSACRAAPACQADCPVHAVDGAALSGATGGPPGLWACFASICCALAPSAPAAIQTARRQAQCTQSRLLAVIAAEQLGLTTCCASMSARCLQQPGPGMGQGSSSGGRGNDAAAGVAEAERPDAAAASGAVQQAAGGSQGGKQGAAGGCTARRCRCNAGWLSPAAPAAIVIGTRRLEGPAAAWQPGCWHLQHRVSAAVRKGLASYCCPCCVHG